MRHVRTQFAHYGPRSDTSEYFGFIYRHEGLISSAVTSGSDCRGFSDCTVNPAFALRRIPKGAKVLGEWHTHPRIGAFELSGDDVRWAHANFRVRCYSAYYSTPDGTVWHWDPVQSTVAAAMSSRVEIGRFRVP